MRVLLGDPRALQVEAYRTHLLASGYEVVTARDGLECVRVLRRFSPDVLVLGTSLQWGGCDGVLAVLDEEPRLHRPLVIVLASDHEAGLLYRLAAMHVGYYECLPLTPRQLQALIQETLARAGEQTPSSAGATEHLAPR